MSKGRSEREGSIVEDKLRSETGLDFTAGTNGGEKSREDRRAKGPVSI